MMKKPLNLGNESPLFAHSITKTKTKTQIRCYHTVLLFFNIINCSFGIAQWIYKPQKLTFPLISFIISKIDH